MMWLKALFVLPIILSVGGIRVPVHKDVTRRSEVKQAGETHRSDDYYSSDESDVEPLPDNHPELDEEDILDVTKTPKTHLEPPKMEIHLDYHNPEDEDKQEEEAPPPAHNDWYPIVQSISVRKYPLRLDQVPSFERFNENQVPFAQNINKPRLLFKDNHVPSVNLEPPLVDAPNVYFAKISEQSELKNKDVMLPQPTKSQKKHHHLPNTRTPKQNLVKQVVSIPDPTLNAYLTPPHKDQTPIKKKHPAKGGPPKKFNRGFVPIVIPVHQYAGKSKFQEPTTETIADLNLEVQPSQDSDIEDVIPEFPEDDKPQVTRTKSEHKPKFLREEPKQEPDSQKYEPSEQETVGNQVTWPSERKTYPSPLRERPFMLAQQESGASPAPSQRTEFRMHGLQGPHSYEFGYDTGKGKNRQFRYEQRDNEGIVRGHYGYVDKHGKLRVVNYSADPKTGFQAETPDELRHR